MTARTPLKSSHWKSYLQTSVLRAGDALHFGLARDVLEERSRSSQLCLTCAGYLADPVVKERVCELQAFVRHEVQLMHVLANSQVLSPLPKRLVS
jgi:hypothetical protein